MLSLPIRSMRGGLNAPTACSLISAEKVAALYQGLLLGF
jgi:hypothetical protein